MIDKATGLLRRRPMNAGQLAGALGVSIATAWRLVGRMRRAGIPVLAVRGRAGWSYSIESRASAPIPRGLPWIPRRARSANKTDLGRLLVIAGSYGMAGAAVLCCRAAHRTGAGLVYLSAPDSIYLPLAASLVETVHRPWKNISDVLEAAERCDAAAIGPGLGPQDELVEKILSHFDRPIVADADAINVLSRRAIRTRAPLVLTPHEGELSRLIRRPVEAIRRRRESIAETTAKKRGIVLVLKGAGTIVTDGTRTHVNPTGNPGMATGGSGDVLTGIIGALLAQRFKPFDAARLGVWLHGRAGDLAAAEQGEGSIIARDLIDALPRALRERSR